MTEGRDDYAVTVTVEEETAAAMPDQDGGAPVRFSVSDAFIADQSARA